MAFILTEVVFTKPKVKFLFGQRLTNLILKSFVVSSISITNS